MKVHKTLHDPYLYEIECGMLLLSLYACTYRQPQTEHYSHKNKNKFHTLCSYVKQILVLLLTAHIQCIPSVITTVAVSTGILKFVGAVELGRSRQ